MIVLKSIYKSAVVAAVALFMVSCADKKGMSSASKDNMIPDDAVMALKIDVDQIWNKALGDEDSEVRGYLNMAKSMLSMSADEFEELGDVAKDVLKDPKALGVCMEEPMVLSLSAELEDMENEMAAMEVYLVALLDDSDAFVKVADAFMDLANEEAELGMTKEVVNDAYTYYVCQVEDEVTVDMGVAEESAVLRITVNTMSQKQDSQKTMLSLFADGGPDKTEGLGSFYASKGDLAAWIDIHGVMDLMIPAFEEIEPSMTAQFEELLPMCEDASAVADLHLLDGKTEFNISVFGSEQMKANAMKYNTASSDKYFKYMPSSSVFVANLAIKDFAGLVEELTKTNEEFAEMFESLGSIGITEELLEGFPGVITFALDGKNIDQLDFPGMTLIMECEQNVWDFAKQYLEMFGESCGFNTYCVEDMLYVSYKNGAIMACDANTYAAGEVYDNFSRLPLADKIAKGGFALNLAALPTDLLDEIAQEIDSYMTPEEMLEYFSSFVVTYSDDHMTSTVTLNMDDKEHNLLEKVVLYVVESAF